MCRAIQCCSRVSANTSPHLWGKAISSRSLDRPHSTQRSRYLHLVTRTHIHPVPNHQRRIRPFRIIQTHPQIIRLPHLIHRAEMLEATGDGRQGRALIGNPASHLPSLILLPLRSPTKPHRQRLPGRIQPFPLAGDFEKGVPLHRAAHHIAAEGEL